MKTKSRIGTVVALSFSLLIADNLPAQEAPPTSETAENSPLGVRQQRIKRMLVDLERQFGEIARKLEAEQPEQSAKLNSAFKRSKELLLQQRVDEITKLLDVAKLETAVEAQEKMVKDVKSLIEMLLEDEDPMDKLDDDIEQLEAWKKKLDDLIADENDLKNETDILDDKDGVLNSLDKQIDKLKEIIESQEGLKSKTSEDGKKGQDQLDQLADKQSKLRNETEKLSGAVERNLGESKKEDAPETPGLNALRMAQSDQKGAASEMEKGKADEAEQRQGDALDDLKKALGELEKEKERIAGLGPEKSDELAERQEKTGEDTGELGDEMAQSPQASENSEGQNGVQKAQQALESAKQSMGKASKNLAQQNSGDASKNQKKALDDLEEARDQIEQQLAELKEQQKEERLAQLAEIFGEMLERQKLATAGTLAIDEGRDPEKLKRAERLALNKWSSEEKALAEMATDAFDRLVDEDLSVVFRTVVEGLVDSLLSVAKEMDKQRTGVFVQRSQKEIETTLEELLAALEKAQEQMAQEQQQQQPGEMAQGQQPLLPPSAELKLLKLSQERINRRTLDLDNERAKGDLDEDLAKILMKITILQEDLSTMALEMAARAQLRGAEID